MSTDVQTPDPPAPSSWPILTPIERRLLGVLAEKAQTTAGGGPLTVNALVTGSNQKSNRDPLMNVSESQVEEGLSLARQKGLVVRIQGGRVEHWKHTLYESWRLSRAELAVLAELLLRGPQTEGELRGRASRMEPIDDLDILRTILQGLKSRGLVVYLTPEDRRGAVLTHCFYSPEEMRRLVAKAAPAPPPMALDLGAPAVEIAQQHKPTDETLAALGVLREEIEALRRRVESVEAGLQSIKEGLGIS